jgi:hypothetical protein
MLYSPTYNGKPYVSLTNDLNNGYKYLADNNIIVDEVEYSLWFFDKAEIFPLVEFNTKTQEF